MSCIEVPRHVLLCCAIIILVGCFVGCSSTPSNSSVDLSVYRKNINVRHFYDYYSPLKTRTEGIEELKKLLSDSVPKIHPRLFFTLDELQDIKRRIGSDPVKSIVTKIQQRADSYLDKGDKNYVDPYDLVNSVVAGVGKDQLAPLLGRRLTVVLEDLCLMWLLTDNEMYAKHASLILEQLCQYYGADSVLMKGARFAPHAMGEMVYGVAIAYDWLYGYLDSGVQKSLAEFMAGYLKSMREYTERSNAFWIPHHNWSGIVGGGMGLAALAIEGAIEGFDVYPYMWLAYDTIDLWLEHGFDPKGAAFDGSGYLHLGLSFAVPFAEALKLRGGPSLYDNESLENVIPYLVGEVVPGMDVYNALIRGYYRKEEYGFIPLKLAQEYNNPLGVWLWERVYTGAYPLSVIWYPIGMQSTTPEEAGEPLANYYDKRGHVNFRTGWAEDDLSFTLTSSPYYPGNHSESDKNHFTLYAYGNWFAIDCEGSEPLTEAHNGVLIDGQGQVPSGGGKGVDGIITSFADSGVYGFAKGDAAAAYQRDWDGAKGLPVVVADRYALYVKGNHKTELPSTDPFPYIVIFDDIQKLKDEAKYTWLLHTENGIVDVCPGDDDRGPNTFQLISSRTEDVLEVIFFNPTDFDLGATIIGSPRFPSHPRIEVSTHAINPYFLSVLLPIREMWKKGLPTPSNLNGDGYVGGQLLWGDYRDVMLVSTSGEISHEIIKSDAKFVHVRLDANGNVKSWIVIGATRLKIDDNQVLKEKEKGNYIYDGSTILEY
jgi:hypothetical protein